MLDTFLDYLPAWPVSAAFACALLAAILSIIKMARTATCLLCISLCVALLSGVIELSGFVSCSLIILSALAFQRSNTRLGLCMSGIGLFSLSVLALLHALPGFHNPQLIAGLTLSTDSLPYKLYLNYDKLLLAAVLLLFVVPDSRAVTMKSLLTLLGGFILLSGLCLTIAQQTGLVRAELKLPDITLLWMLSNLFVTCFAEEAFFRGFIQQQVQRWLKTPCSPWVLVISGGLFGLAHFPAGASYVLIATLLGTYYAYCYQRSQHILLPIGLHFGFNCLHFFAFSYPYLRH